MKYSQKQAICASIIVVVLVLSPIWQNWASNPKDSFPLSYYPMFSKKREATYGVYYFVGYDTAKNRYTIPYKMAGTGGFNQVRRQIKKKARSSNAQAFTQQVAARIGKENRYPYNKLLHIELVKGYYHLENYFLQQDTLPVYEKTLAVQLIK